MNHFQEFAHRAKFIGQYFGYPDCCINDFATRAEAGGFAKDANPHQLLVTDGHGFIPCPRCADKILRGETTIDRLIIGRMCKTPYPQGGSRTQLTQFLNAVLNPAI